MSDSQQEELMRGMKELTALVRGLEQNLERLAALNAGRKEPRDTPSKRAAQSEATKVVELIRAATETSIERIGDASKQLTSLVVQLNKAVTDLPHQVQRAVVEAAKQSGSTPAIEALDERTSTIARGVAELGEQLAQVTTNLANLQQEITGVATRIARGNAVVLAALQKPQPPQSPSTMQPPAPPSETPLERLKKRLPANWHTLKPLALAQHVAHALGKDAENIQLPKGWAYMQKAHFLKALLNANSVL